MNANLSVEKKFQLHILQSFLEKPASIDVKYMFQESWTCLMRCKQPESLPDYPSFYFNSWWWVNPQHFWEFLCRQKSQWKLPELSMLVYLQFEKRYCIWRYNRWKPGEMSIVIPLITKSILFSYRWDLVSQISQLLKMSRKCPIAFITLNLGLIFQQWNRGKLDF